MRLRLFYSRRFEETEDSRHLDADTDRWRHVRMEQPGFQPGDENGYQSASYRWRRFAGKLERRAGLGMQLRATLRCVI